MASLSYKKYWIWFGAIIGLIAGGIEIYNLWKDNQAIAAPITFVQVTVSADPENPKRAIVKTRFRRTNPDCHYTAWQPLVVDSLGFRHDVATTVGKARTVGANKLLGDTYYVVWGDAVTPGIATFQGTITYLCENKSVVVDYPAGLEFEIRPFKDE